VAIFLAYFLYKEFVRKIGKKFPFLVYKLQCIFATKIRHFFIMKKMERKRMAWGLKKEFLRNSSKRRKEKEKEKKRYGKEREEGEERRPLPSSRLNYAARS
jgi:hypothetical protein